MGNIMPGRSSRGPGGIPDWEKALLTGGASQRKGQKWDKCPIGNAEEVKNRSRGERPAFEDHASGTSSQDDS